MKFILYILLILIIIFLVFWALKGKEEGKVEVTNFEECIQAGNAVMESYPQQCRDKDGNLFIEDIGNELEKQDLIRIDSPRPNQIVESPLEISGQAVGYWFFEGDFPIDLVDWDGRIITTSIAYTDEEWMTEEFVPFTAQLEFIPVDTSISNRGSLILHKDNPSGLPENDDALEIPIKFK